MIDELEMLSQLGLNKFLDPSDLVGAVMDRRNNPRRDIEALGRSYTICLSCHGRG